MLDLEYASDVIMAASDLGRMRAAILEIKDVLKLEHIVYYRLQAPRAVDAEPLMILSYDPQWVRRYTERDYFKIDPLVTLGASASAPIDWLDLDRQTFSVGRMFAEAERYGVGRQGVTIPIRGPGGERALFTGTSNVDYRTWTAERDVHVETLTTIGRYIHDRVAHITGARIEDGPRLSPREHQYIQLIVRGKTPKQIAGLLDVSESAIRMTLSSAKFKLNGATLYQAVAKAVTLGIVIP